MRRRPCRRCAVSIFSSSSRLASSSGVSLPVSIHQPVSSSQRTRLPWSISHWMASVISSSPRGDGSIAANGVVDRAVEQVHADEREVARRVGRLLDEPDDVAVGVELGDAEAVRVGHLLEQDLRRRRLGAGAGRLERVHERAEVLLEQVVAEVHHEVVVAEEVGGDQHAVGEAERRVLRDVGDRGAELRLPSPSAAITSARVSPTMTPISVMPAATIASIP